MYIFKYFCNGENIGVMQKEKQKCKHFIDGCCIILGNDKAHAELRFAAVNGFCLPYVRITQAAHARDNFRGVDRVLVYCVCHNFYPPNFQWGRQNRPPPC